MAATKKKKLTSKDKKLALARYLERLADGRVQPSSKYFGICYNLDRFMDDLKCGAHSYGMVPTYAKGWPKHSGSDAFPVVENWEDKNRWSGKPGARRKDLCRYIAKKLRSEVRKGKYKIRWTA